MHLFAITSLDAGCSEYGRTEKQWRINLAERLSKTRQF
jgi:hypothetical protein